MIVNPWSVVALTLDGASFGLAAVTTVMGGKLFVRVGASGLTGDQVQQREDRLYLVFWMGVVLLLVRFMAWPYFYLVLHSFIPEIEGAMCIFGTRNLLPRLTRFLEVAKPLLFVVGLVWLLLFRLERFYTTRQTGVASRRGLLLLLLCSVLALVESGGSAWLWMRASGDLAVSCCTTITDIPSRFTVWMPEALFGTEYDQVLWGVYYGGNLVMVGLLIFVLLLLALHRGGVAWGLATVFMGAVANVVLTVMAAIEVLAPRLMHLPFHHCLYCLVQNVADAPLFAALFIVGTSCCLAGWPLWLLARSWAAGAPLLRMERRLMQTACLFLAGSLVMITVHLV